MASVGKCLHPLDVVRTFSLPLFRIAVFNFVFGPAAMSFFDRYVGSPGMDYCLLADQGRSVGRTSARDGCGDEGSRDRPTFVSHAEELSCRWQPPPRFSVRFRSRSPVCVPVSFPLPLPLPSSPRTPPPRLACRRTHGPSRRRTDFPRGSWELDTMWATLTGALAFCGRRLEQPATDCAGLEVDSEPLASASPRKKLRSWGDAVVPIRSLPLSSRHRPSRHRHRCQSS